MLRVLKPGGLCAITTRYRIQNGSEKSTYGDLYWYADKPVVPKAVRFMELAVPQDPMGEMIAAGYKDCILINSPDLVIKSEAFNDFTQNMIKNAAFRAADSFFSRLDNQELAALEAHVQQKL